MRTEKLQQRVSSPTNRASKRFTSLGSMPGLRRDKLGFERVEEACHRCVLIAVGRIVTPDGKAATPA
jgi:hypothetical protein